MGGQHAGGHGPLQLSPRLSHLTESLTHAVNDWTNPDNPQCAVFNCYNSIWARGTWSISTT